MAPQVVPTSLGALPKQLGMASPSLTLAAISAKLVAIGKWPRFQSQNCMEANLAGRQRGTCRVILAMPTKRSGVKTAPPKHYDGCLPHKILQGIL